MCVFVCVCFFSRVLFFSFWLGLPWPSWRVDLVTTAATAAPKAAAVSTRFLDNQHACSIVSSSSRLRPSRLFSSPLFCSISRSRSPSFSPSLAPPPSLARAPELRPLGKRSDASPDEGPGFLDFGEFWQCGDKKKNQCEFYKELIRQINK